MPNNNWFAETFLPPLFAAARKREKWITANQVSVCVRYMDAHVGHTLGPYGGYYPTCYYTTSWMGREVTLNIVHNSCGLLAFGLDEAEVLAAKKSRINEIRNDPAWLARHIRDLHRRIEEQKRLYAIDIKNLEYITKKEREHPDQLSELRDMRKGIEECIETDMATIQKYEAELAEFIG